MSAPRCFGSRAMVRRVAARCGTGSDRRLLCYRKRWLGNLFRHREDHVEILHGQQFGGALPEPVRAGQPLTLGTMAVAAGAIDDAGVLAVVAPFDGAAQRGGTAVLDGPHHSMLMQGQGMRLPVGGAVLSKDVGQLQGWPEAWRAAKAWPWIWLSVCGRGVFWRSS